jgi:hypothetical protein
MRSSLSTVTVQNFVKVALGNSGNNAVMRHDVTAEDMKFRLEQLSGIGRLAVSRTPAATTYPSADYNFVYSVTFLSNRGDVPMLIDDSSTLQRADTTGQTLTSGSVAISEATKGVASPTSYTIPNLTNGARYHVRVAAANDMGYGPWTTTTVRNDGGMPGSLNFPCVTSPCALAPLRTGGMVPLVSGVRQAPGAPPSVSYSVKSSSQVEIAWAAASGRGDEVDNYKIEWFTAQGTSEVKVIKLDNVGFTTPIVDSAGFWTYTDTGASPSSETTARIPWDATANDVKHYLENLPSTTQVEVTRTALNAGGTGVVSGYEWSITYVQDIGDIADGSVQTVDLYCETGSLQLSITQDGSSDSVVGTAADNFGSYVMDNHQESCSRHTDQGETGQCAQGNREVQTVVTEAASAMSGTFALSYRGQRTTEIPVVATAEQVRAALLSLTTVTDLEVTRSATSMNNGYRWYVTFLSGDGKVDRLVPDGAYLGGQDAVVNLYDAVLITTHKEQVTTHDITGTFKIHLGEERTSALPFDCTSGAMEEALLLLDGVARIDVTKRDTDPGGTADTFEWTLLFKQYDTDLDTLRVVPQADFLGVGAKIEVKRPRGVRRHSFVVGQRAEVQTIDVRAATSTVMAGQFQLTLVNPDSGSSTSTACIPWNATDAQMSAALEDAGAALPIDRVSVVRSGDGMAGSSFGYSFTVTFWGVVGHDSINELIATDLGTGPCASFDGGTDHEVLVHTKKQHSALASYNHGYTALLAGASYTMRVSAKNDRGYGYSINANPITPSPTGVLPGRPTSVARLGYSGTSFELYYNDPAWDGGSDITKYTVELDTSASFNSAKYVSTDVAIVNEVQSVKTVFSREAARGGTFELLWGRKRTTPLAWNAQAEDVSEAIRIVTGAYNQATNPVEVSRSALNNGYEWLITFNGIRGNVGALERDSTLLRGYDPRVIVTEITPGSADITPGDFTYETQVITTEALSDLGGTFTLTFEGYTTDPVAFNASPLDVKLELEKLATIHTVNVEKSFTSVSAGDTGGVSWTVRFTHKVHERVQAAGNIGLLLADTTSLTGTAANVFVTEIVKGSDPYHHVITGLDAGTTYYVRIFAHNFVGSSEPSDTLVFQPQSAPSVPQQVGLAVTSKSSLTTTWSPPVSSNGNVVSSYKIEWYEAEPVTEIQMVTTTSNGHIDEIQIVETAAESDSIANHFVLSFRGESTMRLNEDISASGMKAALERLSTVGTVSVTSDRNNDGFSMRPAQGKVDIISGESKFSCNAGASCAFTTDFSRGDRVWIAGEAFRVSQDTGETFSDSEVPLATVGDITGMTPDTFAGADASGIDALKWAFGHVWRVTFQSGHVGNQETLVATPAAGWTGTDVTLNVFTATEGLQPIAGFFTLAFEGENGLVPTTGPLPHDASAMVVKQALESLVTVGTVDVSRARNGYGHSWLVTFSTNLGPQNAIIAVGTELSGPAASIATSRTRTGVTPTGYGAKIITDLSSLSHTIGSLVTGTPYLVRIAAGNVEGYGPVAYSSPTSETPREKPARPTATSLMSLDSQQLKVVWSAPADGNDSGGATITRYKIEWDTYADFRNIATTGYAHVFTDLSAQAPPYYYNIPITTSGDAYFVRVSAYNNMGYGPTSSPVGPVMPQDSVPSAVYAATLTVQTDVELRVDWIAPRTDLNVHGGAGGRPITQYIVEWDTDFNNPPAALFHAAAGPRAHSRGQVLRARVRVQQPRKRRGCSHDSGLCGPGHPSTCVADCYVSRSSLSHSTAVNMAAPSLGWWSDIWQY